MASVSCPKCGGRVYGAEESAVSFERCSSCEGLWFDHHMLRAWFEKRMSAHDTGDVG